MDVPILELMSCGPGHLIASALAQTSIQALHTCKSERCTSKHQTLRPFMAPTREGGLLPVSESKSPTSFL
jgi:hypothetical protein